MEIIKDKRNCKYCTKKDNCNYKDEIKERYETHCCSNWRDKKGNSYNSYYDTLRYKWIAYRRRKYGHPILEILIYILIVGSFVLIFIHEILESINF